MQRLLLLLLTLILAPAAFTQTKVYLLPTLHKLHLQNKQYNYDTLQAIVKRINPEVIAVEMRPEDEAADTAYLQQNYPVEMWMMRFWHPQATIKGFDWLGAELEGKPIPVRYWQDHSRIKALQKLLATDTVYQKLLGACKLYSDQRMPTLQNGSLKSILQGNDAILTRAYYDCLSTRLRGSDYEELPLFYRERDQQLQQRLLQIIRNNKDQTIVVLTGVDHYTYLLEALRKEVGVNMLQP